MERKQRDKGGIVIVDFNNEATIGTPAANIVKILLLQARANVLESLEYYNKKKSEGVTYGQETVRARIGTWYLEHQPYLERSLSKTAEQKQQYQELKELIEKDFFFSGNDVEDKDLLKMVVRLNNIMDQLRITRVDLKRQYDKTDVEEDNKQNDLE